MKLNAKRTLAFSPVLTVLAVFCPATLEAGPITLNFGAGLKFDPNAIVTGGGASAGDVVATRLWTQL